MIEDVFFEKFELLADAPGAVTKMRELTLALAVQGKFVPQDASDEPASHLLSRIDAERTQLVKAEKIRRQDLLGPIADADIPFPVPEGWEWRHLADVCFLITDGAHHTPQYQETGVPFLSVKDVSSGTIDFSNTRYITPDAHRELCKRCWPERGDILLTKVGTTGIAVTMDDSREFSIFVSLALLKFSQANLDRQFLKYLINSPFVRKQSADNTQGIGNKNLVLRLINQFMVPIPPFAEQKRIVAKVDELMALCDRLEAQQQERENRHAALARASLARFAEAPTPANLNLLFHPSFSIPPADLRKSILTLAVQGKLVPQDSNDEPAAALLKKIEGEKSRRLREATLRNLKEALPIGGDEKDFDLPFNWQWARMGQVVKLWNGFAFKSGDFQPDGVPVIRIGDLQGGLVDLSSAVCVSEHVANSVPLEVWIPENALLLAMSGATTGKVAFNKTGHRLLLNQRVGRLEPILLSTDYVRFFFETIVVRNLSIAFGSAIPNLSAEQINGTVMPVPPVAEQHRIVAKVDELMALVDALETRLATSRRTATALLDAVVHKLTHRN